MKSAECGELLMDERRIGTPAAAAAAEKVEDHNDDLPDPLDLPAETSPVPPHGTDKMRQFLGRPVSQDVAAYLDAQRVPLETSIQEAINHVLEQQPPDAVQEVALRLLKGREQNVLAAVKCDSIGDAEQLRVIIHHAQRIISESRSALRASLPRGTAKERSRYLETLADCLGPKPKGKTWEDEWESLRCESHRISPGKDVDPSWSDAQLLEYVRTHNTVQAFQSRFRQGSVDTLMRREWPEEAARTYAMLSVCSGPIARALQERDACYAASTYALCQSLWDGRRTEEPPPPMLYRHLQGKMGLTEIDPGWSELTIPDIHGFCGLVSNGITPGDCDPLNFGVGGYMRRFQRGTDPPEYIVENSDIVGFISSASDELGAHSAVLTYTDYTGAFPPKTLFRLQRIIPPGEWMAPNGVYPLQRLLVVTATYMPPRCNNTRGGGTEVNGKMCARVTTLSYGSRADYIRGLNDVIAQPVLTMEQECGRQMEWQDQKGVRYSLQREWAYINGPAEPKEGCTAGTRDARNRGKLPSDFQAQTNAFIRERSADATTRHCVVLDPSLMEMNLEEVLAIRLYSGPAYQPINEFLRQVSRLSGAFREELIHHPGLTFSATVGHLCSGIRKLSAITSEEEATRPLFRGVRGELPHEFWHPDEQGIVCAVDMAFMSTSKNRSTPLGYMGEGKNVLWELEPVQESDGGLHIGADISALSQFEAEEEMYSHTESNPVARNRTM